MNGRWVWVARIQEWLAERKRRKNATRFDQGYRYAKETLRSDMFKPEVHLGNLVNMAELMEDYTEFDRGIDAALKEFGYDRDALEDRYYGN